MGAGMTEPSVPLTQPLKPVLPGATLGVLGGGQLGRMWAHEAQRMGYQTVVLDPDAHSPAGLISHHHIRTDYTDPSGLQQMAQLCQAVTTEFENVPADALAQLAQGLPVSPAAAAVAVAQDRAREKAHFVACGVPVAPYAVIDSPAQLAAVSDALLPGILKTARLGYDGKGQQRVSTREDLARAWHDMQNVPCVLEKMLPLLMECSVIVARAQDGNMVHLPVQRNLHRDGILARTEVWPGNVPQALAQQAIAAAQAVAQGLHYVGVLCVEFFVVQEPGAMTLVVNEIAPRPHNSGHYSQDACDVSQFELQVRCMAGLPLTPVRLHSPAIMLNVLGDVWFNTTPAAPNASAGAASAQVQEPREPDWSAVLALPGVHLHLYGKTQARKGRKMGHLNITGDTPEAVRATAERVCALLGMPSA